MTDGFIRKKVESLTLGEKLKKLRLQYRMSYADIAKATRIQAKYLEALENGEYERLPAEVYVRGFLRSYARYLGLDEEAFLKLYDKEKNIRKNLGQEKKAVETQRYPTMNAWVVTPRAAIVTLLVLVLGGTFLYLFSEFRSFVAEPRLVILNPVSGATIDGAGVVVTGKTDPGVSITVNGEPVFVGADGTFAESLALQSGLNRITIRAMNRFDKVREESVAIESRLSGDGSIGQPVEAGAFSGSVFVVRARDQSVSVTIENSEKVLYSGTIASGKEERIEGVKGELKLSTDSGLRTEVRFDDDPFETVAKSEGPVSGKVYAKSILVNDKP